MSVADMVFTRWGLWFMGRRFPVSIGKGGLAVDKREGDGATPCHPMRITGCLYRPDRMSCPVPWATPIGPRDLWSDDSTQPTYNQQVKAPYSGSYECLRRADRLYDLVLLTDWNGPNATPYGGSAIFIHRWRKPRHPTEGCLAFRPDHLRWITARLHIGTRIIPRGEDFSRKIFGPPKFS